MGDVKLKWIQGISNDLMCVSKDWDWFYFIFYACPVYSEWYGIFL